MRRCNGHLPGKTTGMSNPQDDDVGTAPQHKVSHSKPGKWLETKKNGSAKLMHLILSGVNQ